MRGPRARPHACAVRPKEPIEEHIAKKLPRARQEFIAASSAGYREHIADPGAFKIDENKSPLPDFLGVEPGRLRHHKQDVGAQINRNEQKPKFGTPGRIQMKSLKRETEGKIKTEQNPPSLAKPAIARGRRAASHSDSSSYDSAC
jgi:hypothetical protein